MSAHSKIQKSLGIGAYAPQVFTPSATGENIKRAVGELHLTGVTICGLVEVHAEEPQPKPEPKLPPEFINVQETAGQWFIDRVTPHYIETLGRKPTRSGAMAFARSQAWLHGLTVHEGPYVWESAA